MRFNERIPVILLFLCCLGLVSAADAFNYQMAQPPDSDSGYGFYQQPQDQETLKNISRGQIRNIIFCIGDGMGSNHIALARHHALGPDKKLHMERLPVVGVVRIFSADSLITDSAASGTAMASGIKTNNGMIGMTPDKTPYTSILELLQSKGWRSGLVVTSEISHATPAVFFSHIDDRDKQSEIAEQLVLSGVDILFGGGTKHFQKDLLDQMRQVGYQIVHTAEQLNAIQDVPAIGLFAEEGMTTFSPEPSLEQMTQKAIELLSRKSKEWFSPQPKFFLMVEGSQIDWAAHANDTERVIRQTLLFDMAVSQAIEFARQDKHTLVLVTADHETGGLVIETELLDKFKIDPDWEETGHTAADVLLFAYGPGADRFSGVMDNTEIPKRIAELVGIDQFPQQHSKPKAAISTSSY